MGGGEEKEVNIRKEREEGDRNNKSGKRVKRRYCYFIFFWKSAAYHTLQQTRWGSRPSLFLCSWVLSSTPLPLPQTQMCQDRRCVRKTRGDASPRYLPSRQSAHVCVCRVSEDVTCVLTVTERSWLRLRLPLDYLFC